MKREFRVTITLGDGSGLDQLEALILADGTELTDRQRELYCWKALFRGIDELRHADIGEQQRKATS